MTSPVRAILYGALALVAGCAAANLGREFHAKARPFALREHRQWWREAERCSRTRGNFARARIFVVNDTGDSFYTTLGWSYAAAWSDKYVILIAQRWRHHADLFRHEALHLLASPKYHDPAVYQRGPCAAITICWGPCLADTIPPSLWTDSSHPTL